MSLYNLLVYTFLGTCAWLDEPLTTCKILIIFPSLQAFESCLIQAVGGIEELKLQVADQAKAWAEAQNQLSGAGVQLHQLKGLVEAVLSSLRNIEDDTANINRKLLRQQDGEATCHYHASCIPMASFQQLFRHWPFHV